MKNKQTTIAKEWDWESEIAAAWMWDKKIPDAIAFIKRVVAQTRATTLEQCLAVLPKKKEIGYENSREAAEFNTAIDELRQAINSLKQV